MTQLKTAEGVARLAGMHAAAALALGPDIVAGVIARCH